MARFTAFTSPIRSIVLLAITLLTIVVLPKVVRAGNGSFQNGTYDFCVSVRFNATAAQLQQIRTAFENANRVFADATDGQQRFGTIHIVNNSGASQTAEYWIHPGMGRAYATQGKYGVRNEHINMFFNSNFQATNPDLDAFTIAHEHAHHVFGVLDEYSGPGKPCNAPGTCADCEDKGNTTATLNFSLMDNYRTRGGRFGGGNTYTLNEFCVVGNHDPDNDTYQEVVHGKSCWEIISKHPKRSAVAPAGLPVDAPPAVATPTFHDEAGDLRVMLLLDRSGSMSTDQRLVFAKLGGSLFADFVRNGDGIGVSSFADSGTVNFPLTTVTGSGTRSAAKAAINSLVANGSTNIGGGLLTALGQITSQPDRSCNEIIVLLSDGDHNIGTPPASVIGALQDAGVTVLTVGVGAGISASGEATLQNIANQTGGKYYRVSNAFSLVGLFLRLVMESIGNGLMTHSPQAISTGQVREIPVPVETGAANATFAITIADPSDAITLSLRTPSGTIITEATAGTNSNVQFISGTNSKAFQINAPEAGIWTMIVTAGTINTGVFEALAFADHDGLQLNVSVTDDTVTSPVAVEIQATPTFGGESVTCSQVPTTLPDNENAISLLNANTMICPTVTGTVTRPNGPPVPVELFDDGLAIHADAIGGDGTYSARFNTYQGNGTYTFDLTAVVMNGMTYAGENLFSDDPSNTETVPPFTRSASTTAVVTGVTSIPHIFGINPNQGSRGQTLNIAVTGENTNFTGGVSVASFSDTGIIVNSMTVTSPTTATANITIAADAPLTFRDVIITTGGEVATALSAFQVLPQVAFPNIIGVAPGQGQRLQTLNLEITAENTNFLSGVTAVSLSGAGITVNNTTVNSATSVTANITIALNAALTLRDVSVATGSEIVTESGSFQVLSASPVCTNANPSTVLITPPNRALVPVNILGVTDPDNDPLTVSITTIRQDEPMDHIGDGSFSPDSLISGSTAYVRADAILGTVVVNGVTYVGNGRFYHINFTATDGASQMCTGTVRVGVPHVITAPPIDDGPLFNSLSAAPARFSDFDGDRRSDAAIFRQGEWRISNTASGQLTTVNFGLPNDRIVPADFDGDGNTDVAVFRDGLWYLRQSSNGFATMNFGRAGDVPVPADYDGDGRDDLAVFRNGVWYLLRSSQGFTTIDFGLETDKPVPADYDGDGRTDVAVFRGGTWYLLRSAQGFTSIQFGLALDKAVPADYDGDGNADLAVFRSGTWYLMRSLQGSLTTQFGNPTDIPTPADYDGDGKADISVFRDGTWFRLNSANGQFVAVQFGTASDKPIPSAFVP